MKHKILIFLFALSAISIIKADEKLQLSEIRIGTGYFHNERSEDIFDYRVIPYTITLCFDLHPYFDWKNYKSTFKLTSEFFCNKARSHYDDGIETGIGIGLLYTIPLYRKIDLYLEGGVAPMYLGVRTKGQGAQSFNFLDQGGAGFKILSYKNIAFNIGYRYRHTSHGNIRSGPNSGFNTRGLFFSISKLL